MANKKYMFPVRNIQNRLYGTADMLTGKTLDIGFTFIKNELGVELSYSNLKDIIEVSSILKRYDKRYDKHTIKVNKKQIMYGEFILNVAHNTFVYVSSKKDVHYNGEEDIKLYLYIFGKRSVAFKKYIERKLENRRMNTFHHFKISVSKNDSEMISSSCCTFVPRPFDTLYFNDNIRDEIKHHIDTWLQSENTMKSRGLIYKTGILVYGNPGTGKSSIALALCEYLQCDLISIDVSVFKESSLSNLVDAIASYPDKKFVILIDEIDTIYKSRDDEDSTDDEKVTATELLKFLDSPESPSNVVILATTNYINKLENTEIMRKGRFNAVYEIGDINRNVAIEMCKGFNVKDEDIVKILGDIDTINPAELQQRIIEFETNNISLSSIIEDTSDEKE